MGAKNACTLVIVMKLKRIYVKLRGGFFFINMYCILCTYIEVK